jgi:energy-coupling factor transporter ATP-binding protein EcfA2
MNINVGTSLTSFGEKPFTIDLNKAQFRHAWLIGKSGCGKSTLLRNLVNGAIRAGYGVVVVEPHGDLIHDCFNYIPDSRKKDLLYIAPDTDRAPGLGIFEGTDPERVVQSAMSLFEALSGIGWGPETASIFRNAIDAIMEAVKHPTILHLARFLGDSRYADKILKKCENPTVQAFHYKYFVEFKPLDRARAWSHPNNKVEELMRPGVREFLCQKKNLNFVSVLDRQKILLCRLPKGLMGERPARVLGSIIISKLNLASFQRKKRNKPVLVIIDEAHNYLDLVDLDTMFAEGRKNGIHYILANQTIRQMKNSGNDNDAIAFGNASHIFSFRISASDSEQVASNFGNEEVDRELVMLPNYHFKALTMRDGTPVASDPVALTDRPELVGDEMQARKAMAWAAENTGTPKAEIAKQIAQAMK